MDILLLAQDVTWGGPTGDAIHLSELARQLVGRGHRVRVIIRAESPSGARVDGVEILPLRSSFNLAFSAIRRPHVVLALLQAVYDRRPDIVYSRSCGDLAEALAAKALGLPLVFEVNGDVITERESQRGRALSRPARAWAVRASRRAFLTARSVVTVTDTLRRRLAEDYHVPADRLSVIPNAVDAQRFLPLPAAPARDALGIPPGAMVVAFVGNLAPWQGVEYLVRAFAEILRRRPRAILLVVGDGQARAGLEALAADLGIQHQVLFAGAVPYEKVPQYVAAADVCAAPMTRQRLRSGSSAIKVYEYLACERPVVASRIPGLEFLESEDLGRLVPPEDAGALAATLDRALADVSWRRSAGPRGRAFVLARAGWPAVAASVEAACHAAVAS